MIVRRLHKAETWEIDKPDEERHIFRNDGANGVNDLDSDARAIFEAAAVLVGARVADGAEEFVQQEAVSTVQLDRIKSSIDGASRGVRKVLDDVLDALARERLRAREGFRMRDRTRAPHVVGPAAGLLRRGRTKRQSRRHRRRLAPTVRELDRDFLALGVCEGRERLEGRDVSVGPEARILGSRTALWGDRGGLDE